MSRANVRKYSFDDAVNKYVIVSINDTFVEANKFHNTTNINGVCSLFFNDVDGNGDGQVREDRSVADEE